MDYEGSKLFQEETCETIYVKKAMDGISKYGPTKYYLCDIVGSDGEQPYFINDYIVPVNYIHLMVLNQQLKKIEE